MIEFVSDEDALLVGKAFARGALDLFSSPLNFAAKNKAGSKLKQCSKGFSCGGSCVSKTKTCKSPLPGQAKDYAGWLKLQIVAGAKLSKTQQDDADAMGLTKPSASVAKPKSTKKTNSDKAESLSRGEFKDPLPGKNKPSLPADVKIADNDYEIEYTFKAGNSDVKVHFLDFSGTVRVDFYVDGSTKMSDLPQDQKNVAALKILKIMRYDASQRGDGTQYSTRANDLDGKGDYRALAYNRVAGFSIPRYGKAGLDQYGIVKNGRLVPDTDEWKKSQKKSGAFTDKEIKAIDDDWQKTLKKAST